MSSDVPAPKPSRKRLGTRLVSDDARDFLKHLTVRRGKNAVRSAARCSSDSLDKALSGRKLPTRIAEKLEAFASQLTKPPPSEVVDADDAYLAELNARSEERQKRIVRCDDCEVVTYDVVFRTLLPEPTEQEKAEEAEGDVSRRFDRWKTSGGWENLLERAGLVRRCAKHIDDPDALV